jgi:hypothetical protein
MNEFTRILIVLGFAALGGFICLLAVMGRRRSVRRAENALKKLCSQTGVSLSEPDASSLKYFREYPRLLSPLRLAAGLIDGLPVEICMVPIVKRSSKGRTMVGIHCPEPIGAEVGISLRDAASLITNSMFGQANGIGTKQLFGNYDAWGYPNDVRKIFSSEIQSMIIAFPYKFEQIMLYGQEIVMIWKGIEEDVNVVKQVFRLGASLSNVAVKVFH